MDVVQSVADADSKRLEGLAVYFAEDFLRIIERNPLHAVCFYGHDLEAMDFIKSKMEKYFSERGVNVEIGFELGEDCYPIDVGYFLQERNNDKKQQFL